MQCISGALHWWAHAEMVILCLRGRSEYSRCKMKNSAASRSSSRQSKSSSRSRPATGQPVMLRTLSPQAPVVVRPAAARVASTSGRRAISSQWSWTFWRVVSSPCPRPKRCEISPMVRSPFGVRRPPGTLTRIMKWPSFGLSWYRPYHCKRTMSSSGTAS